MTYPVMTAVEAYALAADEPRYKALGNSMARWLGERIESVQQLLSALGMIGLVNAKASRNSLLIPSEEQEQRTLAAWLDLHKILWCHVPNGGARNKATAGKLRAAGVKAGVPDVLVFDPPTRCPDRAKGGCHVIGPEHACPTFEIKRRMSLASRISDSQQNWLLALGERGWVTRVCFGAGEAITLLESLGYGRARS